MVGRQIQMMTLAMRGLRAPLSNLFPDCFGKVLAAARGLI
jgi:hypothetical protein